ncbi:MAG TPA: DNA polymerase III subunit gamma/tau [Alphaproteobacteria bacterium]|nr:DNA polymerase III subunit gamma/tau [Alphaproteobacteria bacterium]
MTDAINSGDPAPYRVLARKYRPATFAELVGQGAMVRTLTNAFQGGRLAHAFILTGVRGVGKTTTARIIAKALNCTGPDGKGGPTVEPCGLCEHCRAIAADRDVDVIEMDAASRTGVDDMRELIDGVRYRPIAARFKVYIIDEVHMLSKSAFNALLKTLEEPPEHVKFIFATTEIRKVPVTVLSRCQRFDLRRVDQDLLAEHLAKVAGAEGAALGPEALQLIARAADGSVRDGLSLLDQAIAHGAGAPSAAQVRDMLGLADRAQILDLFDLEMKGEIKAALALMAELYKAGADPIVVLQDLLEVCHWLSRLKIAPDAEGPVASDAERTRGRGLAETLAVPELARAWQLLLKGLGETQAAPAPLAAAEMTLIRLAYAAELPSPAELVRSLTSAPSGAGPVAPQTGGNGGSASPLAKRAPQSTGRPTQMLARDGTSGTAPASAPASAPLPAGDPMPEPERAELPLPESFEALVETVLAREPILGSVLRNSVHLVRFEAGRLEFRPERTAPANLAPRLIALLSDWTGRRWAISISNEEGAPTLAEAAKRREADRRSEAEAAPLVEALLKSFPGATVEYVRDVEPGVGGEGEGPTPPAALPRAPAPELDGEIDPDLLPEFDDDGERDR